MWDRRAGVAGWCEVVTDALCPACLHRGRSDLASLVFDYIDLEQALTSRGQAGEPITGSREPPSVMNLAAEAHQRAIVLLVSTWERILREQIGLRRLSTADMRDGWLIQRGVRTLREHIVELSLIASTAVLPWGVDGDAEEHTGVDAVLAMTAIHRRVRSFLGVTTLTFALPGECASCEMTGLRRESGSETVFCAYCSNSQTWDMYQEYADRVALDWRQGIGVALFDLDDFLPAGRAATLLGVSTAQLRVWRARGRLHGRQDRGVWTYRARDLLAVNKVRAQRGKR